MAVQKEQPLEPQESAPYISSRYLPPVPYRELPEPMGLRRVLGASMIITATAIGSGEFVLWPNISANVGLVLMWAAVLGFITQYFINMEVERYTLATGETAVTGFTRLWKPWSFLFVVMTIIPNIWPGWSTGASTLITYLAGGGNVVAISIAGLVAIGVALTLSPVVYQAVEKFETVLVTAIAVFLIVAIALGTGAGAWGTFITDFSHTGRFPPFAEVGGIAALLGAIAFAGAGGANNLVQSNYVRDKGMGMGVYLPRIASPFTGQEEAAPGTGYTFQETEDNLRRWRGWWRVANIEQFFTFFVLGCLTLIVMSVLAYSTVFGQQLPADDFAFLRLEGNVLGDRVAPWFTYAFWTAGTIALFSTELGIIDYVSRLTADTLKVTSFRGNDRVSESRIYFVVVWFLIVVGAIVLLAGFEQPFALLVVASSLNGIVMFVYSVLLILINRKYLPGAVRISGFRLGAMGWAVLFYGFFSILLVLDQLGVQLF